MKKKILVVDDDRVMLKFISKLLTREGHDVQTAEDGFAALNLLSELIPDIMFFDLIMPKIDGGKLIKIVDQNAHNFWIFQMAAAETAARFCKTD